MGQVFARFPHIGDQIFINLDDQNLTKCREVCDSWMTFLDNEKLIWARIIMSHIEASNSWNWQKFLSTTSTSMLCKIATRIQHFYKYEYNIHGIVKEMSPLHFAVMMYDDTKYCINLIKNGTINYPKDENGMTPLHYAAKYGYICVCQLLLKNFSDKNPKSTTDKTPLELAVQFDNYPVCELIIRMCEENDAIAAGPRAAITPVSLKRPWITTFPTIFSDLSTVLNPLNKDGLTPLHVAARNGKTEMCKLIMKNILDKNPESMQNHPFYGMTPLHLAAHEGHFSACELLVHNLDIKNPNDQLMRTPLCMAARKGHLLICRLLYENSNNIGNNELCKILEEAVNGGHYDVSKFFVLEIGCRILDFSFCYDLDIILRIAAAKGNLEICKLIITNLQINRITEQKYETPLHAAAKNGHLEIYKLIMKGFQDKNPKNGKRNTPLHFAAKNGHLDLCELILMNIKNKNPRNILDETPMYLAAVNNHNAVCDLFLNRP